MNVRTTLLNSFLVLAGIGLCSYAGSRLEQAGKFEFKPNPLGLKNSPYGQVMAMAVQGPVDKDFHLVMHGVTVPDTEPAPDSADSAAHPAACADPECAHPGHGAAEDEPADPADLPLIDRLARISGERTNPNPPTPAHKLYLRSKIENRLRFAYELDPSHYGNYNSYHLFLTEPQLGTTQQTFREGRDRADELAEETIRYCLRDEHDPRPPLTAATAAYNILESMFYFQEDHSLAEMAEQLRTIDYCLERHRRLLERSVEDGSWELLSPLRQAEILDRANFTQRMRDTAEKALARLAREDRMTASQLNS
jgi:hypothetical protein